MDGRARGGDVLTLTSFEVPTAPDLLVYLMEGQHGEDA